MTLLNKIIMLMATLAAGLILAGCNGADGGEQPGAGSPGASAPQGDNAAKGTGSEALPPPPL